MTQLVNFVNPDGKVSSKLVAEKFGKLHKDVLKSITNLERNLSNDFYKLNFAPKYINTLKASKTEVEEVLMTRDGFSILAMGFTGKEALTWKVKFLEAFNQLERVARDTVPQLMNRLEHLEREQQLRIESENAKRQRSEERKGFITTYIVPMFPAFDNILGLIPKTVSLPRSALTEAEIATNERIHCSNRHKGTGNELSKREQYELAIIAWERLSPEQRNDIPRPLRSSFGLRQ
jgi:Rha family phage regulatory protein